MERFLTYTQTGITLLLLLPIGKMFFLYFKYFVFYMFNSPIFWWNKDIEKPRLLFFILGLCFSTFSWAFFKYNDNNWLLVYILAVCLNLIGLSTMVYIWSKGFEKKLIPFIRENLLSEKLLCPYINGYNINNTLKEFIDKQIIECDLESFFCFLKLKKISSDSKIISYYTKRDLIRFIFIVFDIDDINLKSLSNIISHYFICKDNTPYELSGLKTELPKVKAEILHNKHIYTKLRRDIQSIFLDNIR